MHILKNYPTILFSFLVVMIMSCGSDIIDSSNSVVDSSDAINESKEDTFLIKYNQYIKTTSSLEKDVYGSMEYYYKWGTGNATSSGYRKTTSGPLAISDRWIQEIQETIELTPVIDKIDTAMKELVVKTKALDQLIDEMKVYYDRGDYKEDNYKQAETWHPILDKAFDEYSTAYSLASKEILVVQHELMYKDAERFKAEGFPIRHKLLLAMINAEVIVNDITAANITNIKSFEPEILKSKLTSFTKTCDEILELSKDEKKLEHDFGKFGGSLSLWTQKSSDIIKQTKSFLNRVNTNDFKYGSAHNTFPSIGSQEAVAKEYNSLVEYYNGLN